MKILLVEDHFELSHWLARALEAMHLTVETAYTGDEADALLLTQHYGLVILDLNLPKMDGLDVLRRLRSRSTKIPVMILTARAELADKVQGLNLGADDYLMKPFQLEELEARIKAILRRTQGQDDIVLECGDLRFDTIRRQFTMAYQNLPLTPREFSLLEALISKVGQAISKEKLFDQIFSLDDEVNLQAIEIYIHRLRKKLDTASAGRVGIVTLRGIGYYLDAR